MLPVNAPAQSPAGDFQQGRVVTVHGFISKRRDISSKLSFVDLVVDRGPSFQFMSSWEEKNSTEHQVHKALKQVPAWSSVSLTGIIKDHKPVEKEFGRGFPNNIDHYELALQHVHILSPFPRDIIISEGAQFPPHTRHLQLRFDESLQNRLLFRDFVTKTAQGILGKECFLNVETPILFKSTPEGAREFLVPTRRPGYAYALPQSPQQYKQILMAAGVRGYYQFARCFRDEDLRADRQPEFTQLDLEMSFAKGEDVMRLVESVVQRLYDQIGTAWNTRPINGALCPVSKEDGITPINEYPPIKKEFPRITYQEAMSLHGSDKPDLRIPNKIQRIDHILPRSFTSMISDLENPIVEACVFRFDAPSKDFVKATWDTLPKPLRKNPDGEPVPLIIDSSKPLSGLSPLGHEAASAILDASSSDLPNIPDLEPGDVLVIQARPNKPFEGGSTALGDLRRHIYAKAVEEELLPADNSFKFLWVTGFPLFTPNNDTSDPAEGQHGASGFSSTHHPFTAPLTPEDFDLLAKDPLKVKADHYDLVVNGVELGGGSRRIHIAALQEYIFRDVLKMSDEGVSHFSHLLEALRAGCPPHAGFAFGWDRLVALLSFTGSVRDVIAFPKSKKGDEPVSRAPGKVTEEEWRTYHLKFEKGD
ncbi:aspartate--tRNA ligase msd1 [Diaporthe australafricana]|uniref:Aspartate--tRNA ligase msd1 n=1 Tax=Diaporthe australafricana TaxID=127596 RepID=A0ABR3WL47_9PEZI